MAVPVKRKYDSSRRRAQARETQAAIASAARALFVARGYGATSIRDIADAAAVSVQTIYNLFEGGKPAILLRVIDIAVVGDDEPVALAEREQVRAARTAAKPRDVIVGFARYSTDIFVRMLEIYPVLREATSLEPVIEERWRRNYVEDRWHGTRVVAARLKTLKALPRGMTVDSATDVMYAWASAETALALLGERGWSADQFAAWTAEMFCRLFGVD